MAASLVPSRVYLTSAFSGVPNAKHWDKIRSGYLSPAFSGAQKRANLLPNPCILGGPQRQARGQNQKWLPHPCLPRDQRRAELYVTLTFSGVPNAKRGNKIRSRYLTPTFRGAPKRAKLLCNPWVLKTKREDKIRSGYLTLAFPGVQKRAELLRNPFILMGPQCQAREQNQKWLPHPCLLRGP